MTNFFWKMLKGFRDYGPKIVILAGLYLVVSLVQLPIQLINDHNSVMLNGIWAVVYFAAFAFAIWIARMTYFKYGYRRPKKITKKEIWFIVRCYLLAIVVEIILNSCNLFVNHQVSSRNNQVITQLLGSNRLILFIMSISMVCLSPILEELVFRGYLMDAFFKPRFFWWPIVISGLIFATGHLVTNLISFAVYVSLGMFLAYVYRRTGNIRASILMHALNNLIAVVPLLALLLR